MPIYEFFCPQNHKIYSFLARSVAYSAAQPRCPDNPKFRLERMLSSFSVTGRVKEEAESAAPGGDPTTEAAMAEMEREFHSMNADNPDPRQVARMLRTMTRMSGEKMPEQMEEMMCRLEGGEALDKLEEEFSDVADAVGSESSDEGALMRSGELQKLKERLRAARQRPVRDPVLYDMSEYADLPDARPPEIQPGARRRRSK